MLVLSRRVGERIVIDNNIVLEVLEVKGNRIRLGIQAPGDVSILREELQSRSSGFAVAAPSRGCYSSC